MSTWPAHRSEVRPWRQAQRGGTRADRTLNEAALRRHVGGPDVMHAQLRHLLDQRYQANVEIFVLPYEAGEHPDQGQSFILLTFPEPEDAAVVFLDYAHSSVFLEKQHEIRSSGAQACVAVGFADGWVGVRDTKNASDILVLPAARFAEFLTGKK